MMSLRTGARIGAVSLLVVGGLPLGGAVRADDIRTDTTLGGFSVDVQASPVLVLLDDPNLQIPRPTGTSALEADPNYTLASVSAGPNARAVASSLWPGNLFGEGLSAINPQIPPYPIKAESRYPDKPYTAAGPDRGVLTNSTAKGLDATATADGTPTNKPGQVKVGSATSTSTATVDVKNVAIGTATSAVHDVSLLGGVIHIGSVTTHLVTSTDGKSPRSSGSTTVSGLSINGQGYTVDDKGVHAAGHGAGTPPLTSPSQLADLGISIRGIVQSTTKTTNGISRNASGLVIKVDTAPLRKALSPVTGVVNPVLAGIISNLPPDQQGNFYYLLKATPSITFVFGSASTGSAATLPISFSFPPSNFPTAPGGVVSNPGGTVAPGSTAVPPGLDTTSPSVSGPTAPGPVLQAPGTNVASTSNAGFSGIGAGWLLAALVGSGLLAWVLVRFLGLAGGVLGFGCGLGAPTSVPNLRSVAA
jgi:hypothetical protein